MADDDLDLDSEVDEDPGPLLMVGGQAELMAEMRAVRAELAEVKLWLRYVYAEIRAQTAWQSPEQEAAAIRRAKGEVDTIARQIDATVNGVAS